MSTITYPGPTAFGKKATIEVPLGVLLAAIESLQGKPLRDRWGIQYTAKDSKNIKQHAADELGQALNRARSTQKSAA